MALTRLIRGLLLAAITCIPAEGGTPVVARATESELVAHWTFDEPDPLADASGRGHRLELRGRSRIAGDGISGGCLRSFASNQADDRPEGAMAPRSADLSPEGPFAIELWMRPEPELNRQHTAFLIDCKYIFYPRPGTAANSGYCLYLRRVGDGQYQIVANLGFGSDSAEYRSATLPLKAGNWYRVAFVYNGAGVGRILLDGELVGRGIAPGRRGIAPARYALTIADRYGSIHSGFPGSVDEVRIFRGVPDELEGGLSASLGQRSRAVFRRHEPDAELLLHLTNDASVPVRSIRATAVGVRSTHSATADRLAPGQSVELAVPVDTTLKPGRYQVRVQLEWTQGTKKSSESASVELHVLPRQLGPRMPVVLWGAGNPQQVRQLGFTHQLVHLVDYDHVWTHGVAGGPMRPPGIRTAFDTLDLHAKHGLQAVVYLYPVSWMRRRSDLVKQYGRVNRKGELYERADICGNFPRVRDFAYQTGLTVGQTFGAHPALAASLIHSEVRDATEVCFHPHDIQLFRAFAGQNVPPLVRSKWGVPYQQIPSFPPDRVVADRDPLLLYYRWFWKQGDGWNDLHSLVHRGLKEGARGRDLWTFFDPAVRAPSIWGSGGEVDVLSQWTYTYPDPIKIGQACDELFAMASGRPGQRVMKMTQIIWYRSQTAPRTDQRRSADWERREPDARFITIAPDHLREAFWCKIARPVEGIMYHGWGSLVPGQQGAYRFTHPGAAEVLRELISRVIEPLGPTLLAVKEYPADVAILESFTSQMFARRGTFGWSRGWEADLHLALQWAGLQPEILYEEHIEKAVPERVRVLLMPYCDVLPASVVKSIRRFQDRGGLVVGDESLCPAIRANMQVRSYRRTGKPDADKRALQELGRKLARQLAEVVRPPVSSSSPDVLVYRRQYRNALYLFLVNDRRTFGDYVGQHGLVMEKGLPAQATITLHGGPWYLYDLVRNEPVPAEAGTAQTVFGVKLEPAEGRILLATDKPVGSLHVTVPPKIKAGESVSLTVTVRDDQGAPVRAVVPVQITLRGPDGAPHELTGAYAACDGRLVIPFDFAPNETSGRWTLTVRELASGREQQVSLDVRPAE